MKSSRLIKSTRKAAITEAGLSDYFEDLGGLIKSKAAGTDRIHNIDETGIQEGESVAGKVLGTALTRLAETVKSDATN